MKDTYILAFESSCDETSVSIIKNGHDEIATVVLTQMDIHALYGGVVPEIASRHHVESITIVIEECLNKAGMKIEDIDAIAVTYGPGLIGSLLVGMQAAKTLAYLYNKPLVPVHHIAGHTDLVLMEEDYSFKRIGGTLDDAIGEAYDKVARVINVPYPGGPLIDKMAFEGEDTYKLPIPLDDDSYNFSFSGIKSAVINLVHNEEQRGNKIIKENLACSFQNRVTDILVKKTMKALKEYNVHNLIVAGGVAANKGLRSKLEKECKLENIKLCVPDIKYCTDNAAMIGAAGYYAYKLGRTADLNINSKANDSLK